MRTGIKRALWFLCAVFAVVAVCFIVTATGKTSVKADEPDYTFEMVNGASVRFADDDSGIRFRVKMGEDMYNEIVTNDDGDHVTLKFIITSKANFDAADGNYYDIVNKRVADVLESKIYRENDYYYANGCLTQIRTNNRNVSLVAIAVKLVDGVVDDYADISGVGATGRMYDVLNQALLATSKDYIPNIISTTAFSSWYGSADYPVYINTSADYEKLANKFETKSAQLERLKYNIVDEVNARTIENSTFDNNVTTTYKVTFNPNNGDAVVSNVYKAGDEIVKPADPEKAGDNTYTYSFNGWGAVVPETCSASATYTAQYNSAFKNYTVTFKTHDGSSVLNTKTDYHYGDEITTAPEVGTTYTVAGNGYEVAAYQTEFDTVTENIEILAASYKLAPTDKVQGYFYTYTDGDPNGGVPVQNKFVSFNSHNTFGNYTTLNGERVLYRTFKSRAALWDNSDIGLRFATNDILTEIYVPFYLISVEGNIDMNLRLYAGSGTTLLPVAFKDAGGNTVDKASLETETWYTAVYSLAGASATFNQRYCLTMGEIGSSIDLYLGRPYFTLMDGVDVNTFNTEIKDNFQVLYDAYNNKTKEIFSYANVTTVSSFTYVNDTLLPAYNNGYLSFSEEIWNQYLGYQATGGKIMTMDVKFLDIGKGATISYNGEIYNGSSYVAVSNALSNTFRQTNKFVRLYDSEGQSVNYQSIVVGVPYKMEIDIDAIKAGVAEQTNRNVSGVNVSSFSLRSGDNGFAIGNIAFEDNIAAITNTSTTTAVSSVYEDGTLVSTIPVGNDDKAKFSNTVSNNYIAAQTEGGKLMTFDVKFTGSGTYQGFISWAGSTAFMSNNIRGNRKYVRFYDAEGNEVTYDSSNGVPTDVWYKMVVDIDAIKNDGGSQIINGSGASTGLSLRFWKNVSGTMSIKNVQFVDKFDFISAFDSVVILEGGNGGTVSTDYENGKLVTVGTSSHQWDGRLSFKDAVWEAYLAAQDKGGKVMQMDIKFGGSVSLSGYLSGSSANLNSYRANTTYFRFYDTNGNQVLYSELVAETWYRIILDIDAIKTGIGAQAIHNTNYSSIYFARESAGTISLKNVEFVDNLIIFKDAKAENAVYSYYEGDTLITRIDYGSSYKTPFSDTIANAYIDAQNNLTGKVLRFDVKFTGGYTTYNGFIYQNGANYGNVYMSNNIRGNRTYIRFYDTNGDEVAYTSLAEDTWYKMVVDIDAIESFTAQDIRSLDSASGLSLRFYANEAGESIYVKNAEIVDKANENS